MTKRRGAGGNLFMAPVEGPVPPWRRAFNYLVVCVLVVAVVGASLAATGISLNFDFINQYSMRIEDGFLMTIGLSAASLAASLVIGIPVAAGSRSRFLPLRSLCALYVTIIRGTPLIVQIYFFYYIIGTAWGVENKVVAGIIILSVFSGAYIAEIVRAGYESLPQGPLEAARALGMTRMQTLVKVALPQMVTRTLPALTGQFASIIKDSSLLSVIAVIELTQTMREISATNYNFFGCFLLLGALYLVLTLPVMLVSRHFEKKWSFDH